MKWFIALLIFCLAISSTFAQKANKANKANKAKGAKNPGRPSIWVGPTTGACVGTDSTTTTLAGGIAAAADGYDIFVCPGVYTGDVAVTKAVRIIGSSDPITGIDGQVTVTAAGAELRALTFASTAASLANPDGQDKANGGVGFLVRLLADLTVVENCTFYIDDAQSGLNVNANGVKVLKSSFFELAANGEKHLAILVGGLVAVDITDVLIKDNTIVTAVPVIFSLQTTLDSVNVINNVVTLTDSNDAFQFICPFAVTCTHTNYVFRDNTIQSSANGGPWALYVKNSNVDGLEFVNNLVDFSQATESALLAIKAGAVADATFEWNTVSLTEGLVEARSDTDVLLDTVSFSHNDITLATDFPAFSNPGTGTFTLNNLRFRSNRVTWPAAATSGLFGGPFSLAGSLDVKQNELLYTL
jgi:hypothetical protein